MKIDKRNPAHWLYLLVFALNVALAMLLRPCLPARRRPLVLLYGHKLNGNLKSLYDYAETQPAAPLEICFLGMDPTDCVELRRAGYRVIPAVSPRAILALARVRCIVSDHGLHVMSWLPAFSGIRFADVWHGIPFKGWDAGDFSILRAYDEIWLSSALIKSFYIDRFGFRPEQLQVTGYGRTDQLVNTPHGDAALRSRLGLQSEQRVILFAPTWQHGNAAHRLFPFELEGEEFFRAVGAVCLAHNAVCLVRTHLNSGDLPLGGEGPFRAASSNHYPDSEAILRISDMLVCDWSSIAFDFLVLERPTIFLDVPAPFPKGMTLGAEYRYGEIAASLDDLVNALTRYLEQPEDYYRQHRERMQAIKQAVYDDCADGHAAERYYQRLLGLCGCAIE